MIAIYFDKILKTRKGKKLSFWDCGYLEREVDDNELVWFNDGYGLMKLYRLIKVDEKNYIAKNTKCSVTINNERWKEYSSNPELALKELNV